MRFIAAVVLAAWVGICAAQSTPTPPAGKSVGPITVGANVQVSRSRSDQAHWEVLVAADPENPNHLLACTMVAPKLSEQLYTAAAYVSFDGGVSWQESLQINEGWQIADPACAYGPGGVAYLTVLVQGYAGDSARSRMLFFKSSDSGRTWSKPLELPTIDREYLTVDNTTEKFRGRIYVHGTGVVRSIEREPRIITGIDLFRSADGGNSFLGPIKVAATEPKHIVEGMGNGVVLSDGTFVAITGELEDEDNYDHTRPYKAIGRIIVVSSKDGGQTLLPPVTVSDWYTNFEHKITSSALPVLAVDSTNGPFKDRLYAVWGDLRSGRKEAYLSFSSDKGKTWSAPTIVNDDTPRAELADAPDNFMPTVAVNSSGVVGVMWYDRRDNPDNLGYWPRFSASLDGGETFLPSVRLSEAPMDLQNPKQVTLTPHSIGGGARVGAGGNVQFWFGVDFMQFSGGHTSGLAASPDGTFHPVWVDNRTGLAQLWTAPVTVAGKAILNGDEELAGLADVTDKVELVFGRPAYDHAKHVVTVDAHVLNTSKQALAGPFMLRLVSLRSRVGVVEVANADNKCERAGAVWTLMPKGDSPLLPAGERSEARKLEFRLRELPEAGRSPEALFRMIEARAKVFASRDS